MNTKGIKFLAVLAVLAMAFAAFAVIADSQSEDADPVSDTSVAKLVRAGQADKGFTTLAAAITAADAANDIVEVLKDCTLSGTNNLIDSVTLKVPTGRTVTLVEGAKLNVAGSIINDGTIANDSTEAKWVTGNTDAIKINGAHAEIKSTSSSSKGTITGTNQPLVNIYEGKIQDQIIDGTRYVVTTDTSDKELNQCIKGNTSTKNITIDGCYFKINKLGYGIDLALGEDYKIEITNNVFDSGSEPVQKLISVNAASASSISEGNGIIITGIDDSRVKYFEKGAALQLGGAYAGGSTVGLKLAETTAYSVNIDASVKNIQVAGSNWTIKSNLTLNMLTIKRGLSVTLFKDCALNSDIFFMPGYASSASKIPDVSYKSGEYAKGTIVLMSGSSLDGKLMNPYTSGTVLTLGMENPSAASANVKIKSADNATQISAQDAEKNGIILTGTIEATDSGESFVGTKGGVFVNNVTVKTGKLTLGGAEIITETTAGLTVQAAGSLEIYDGSTVTVTAKLEFARNYAGEGHAAGGLSGTGKVVVTGTIILNQDSNSKLVAGSNAIVVKTGAKMYVVEYANETGTYWNIVGDTAATETLPWNAGAIDDSKKFLFAVAESSSVTIKENWSGSALTGTDYTFDGTVTIGASNWLAETFFFDYFASGDKVIASSGETIFQLGGTIVNGVSINVLEGAKLTIPTGKTLALGDSVVLTMEDGAIVSGKVTGGKTETPEGDVKTVTELDEGKTIAEMIAADDSAGKDTMVTASSDIVASINSNKIAIEKANVTFAGSGQSIATLDITVKATGDESKAVTFNGFTAISGKITTTDGVTTQTITLTNLKGNFTVTKGSIYIDGELQGGLIELDKNVDVKLTGSVDTANVTIKMKTDGDAATVTIEKGEKVTIDSTVGKLIIGKGITLNVYGTITNAEGKNGILVVSDGAFLNVMKGGKIAKTGANTITVDRQETPVTGSTNVAYSGSDVNTATLAAIADWTGKDANGGTWTYDITDDANILTLKGYNGTYNFGFFADGIKKIIVDGDSSVSYAYTDKYKENDNETLFGHSGNLVIITSETSGSLDISVDVSKVKKDQLFAVNPLTVIKMASAGGEGKYNINGVSVSVTVSGANAEWTTAETKVMKVIGIDATNGFKTFNAELSMDIMSEYSSTEVYGLKVATAGVTINDADVFSISSAGTAIDAAALDIAFIGSESIVLEGNKANTEALAAGIQTAGSLSLTTVKSVEIKGGIGVKSITMLSSSMLVAGTATIDKDAANNSIEMSNKSILTFSGTATIAGKVTTTMESALNLKDATIGLELKNGGIVNITGNVAILSTGKITNNVTMNNTGVLGIYGKFENNGVFNNEGTLEVFGKKFFDADATFNYTGVDAASATTNVKFEEITLADITPNADGSASLKNATVTYYNSAGEVIDNGEKYSGTLTPAADGSYVLTLKNKADTCTLTITYSIITSPEPKFGKSYAIAVTGSIVKNNVTYYLEGNTTGTDAKPIGDQILATEIVANDVGDFLVKAGSTFNNEGTVVVSAATSAPEIIKGTYNGNLITNMANVTVSGDFTGDLIANGTGTVTISEDYDFIGDITTKAAVVVNGDVLGNITTEKGVTAEGGIAGAIIAKENVTVTDLLGSITVNANGPKNVTVKGAMLGEIIYISKYKASASATEPTEYTAKMNVAGEANGTGFTVILAAGSDATASADVVPGFFKLGAMADLDIENGKTVQLVLKEGRLYVDSVVKVKTNYYIVIEANTTIEVNKSAASLDVTEAALKVSKNANALFETGSATPVNYGKVLSIMSFTIDDGAYSIYSDVAYALSNCNEGSVLTVEANAPISTSVSVPDGVNIIVKNVTLTFNGFDVAMGEGAKITLEGTGKVIFKASKDNTAAADLDDEIEYEYYAVDAAIVFGDNAVVFDGVRFTNESTVAGVAATSTADAKISTILQYNEGTATISEGTGTGTIKLENFAYYLTKEDKKPAVDKKTYVYATFVIGPETVFDAVAITDAFGTVDYDENDDGDVYVKEYKLSPTIVGVEGVLNLSATTEVKGAYAGLGVIKLADGKEFKLLASAPKAIGNDKTIPAHLAVKIVDTTEFENGYVFNLVSASPAKTLTIKATTQKVATVDLKVMTISGDLGTGIVTATDDAFINELDIQEETTVVADAAFIIGDSKALGFLGAKVIYMKEGTGSSDYKTLDYQVTFEEGDYTFYTYFASIDFDEVSDITIAGKADNYLLVSDGTAAPALLPEETLKVDLSGKDVNIYIAEGKTLTVNKPLIIGTPIDDISGLAGSSIVGKVVINKTVDPKVYIVAYSDVDLTLAEIVQSVDKKTAAVYSTLTIEDVLYATIFANDDDVRLSDADKKIVPEIEGYTFTQWINYGPADAKVGDTNAYAGAMPVTLYVTVKFVTGIAYYCNGIEFAIYDTPVKVDYNSVFTAKISDTSKYQGTPLVNGKNSLIITEDTEIVGSGVSPIPVPPEPEPEPVIGDSGISLTDILLIVLVVLIAIMVVILVLRLNRS